MQAVCKNATPANTTIIYRPARVPARDSPPRQQPLSQPQNREKLRQSISMPSSIAFGLTCMGRRKSRLRNWLRRLPVAPSLRGPRKRRAWCWFHVRFAMQQILYKVERDRDKEDRDDARGQHAAEHGETKQDSSVRSGPGCEHERHHAEDKGEGCHEDRTEPHQSCSQGGVHERLPSFELDFRKLHDQDCILGG